MVLTACTSVLTPGLRSSAARGRAGTRIASVEVEDLKTRPFLRVIGIGGGRAHRSGDCAWVDRHRRRVDRGLVHSGVAERLPQ